MTGVVQSMLSAKDRFLALSARSQGRTLKVAFGSIV
jgi:hypothetical protein